MMLDSGPPGEQDLPSCSVIGVRHGQFKSALFSTAHSKICHCHSPIAMSSLI